MTHHDLPGRFGLHHGQQLAARLATTDDEYDVLPVLRARPLLTPPRTAQPADPPMFCYWCPHHRRIEVLTEEITHWPAMARCSDRPVILTLGRAIFVGNHLLVPSKRERLLAVLQNVYREDVLRGSSRAWIDLAGVPSSWEPVSQDTLDEFRRGGLFGRARAPGRSEEQRPELVA